MKNIIRWPGIVVAIVLIVLSYFLIEPLLKLVIEQSGSRALSTTVSLDSVQVGWSDQSLELIGLQVADKETPELNTVQIDSIALQIDALDAISGHLVSEHADILGVRFYTPRSRSNAPQSSLSEGDENTDSGEGFSLPGLDLPDIDSLVSKENSLTYTRYQSFEKYLEDSKASYKQRIEALKDKKKIANYKRRYKEIKKAKGVMGKIKAASKAKDLKKAIDKDLKEAKRLRKDFKKSKKEVTRRIAELKKSPQEEADNALKKVGVDGGTQKIAEVMFGPEMKEKIKNIKTWFDSNEEKSSDSELSVAERGKGIFVQFEQEKPLPLVWFKRAKLSGDFSGLGFPFSFEGQAKHLTDQQALTQQPSILALNLLNDQVKHAKANLLVDTRTEQTLELDFEIKQYELTQLLLSDSFILEKALADTVGSLSSINEQLTGNIDVEMNSVSLKTSGDSFKKYPAIEDALAKEDQITAKIKLSGMIDAPRVSIDSNIDAIFNKVLKQAMNAQLAKYKSQVSEKIESMLQDELAGLEVSQTKFLGLDESIAGTETILKDLIKF